MSEYKNNIVGSSQMDEEVSSLSFIEIWNMFWKHKIWYFISVVIACFFAIVLIYKTPSEYSRSVKLIIDESAQDAAVRNLSSYSGMAAMRLRNGVSVENEKEAFTSPDLMEIVVNDKNLNTVYVEKQFLRKVELYKNSPIELVWTYQNPESPVSFTVHKLDDKSFRLSKMTAGKIKYEEEIEACLGDTISTPLGALALIPNSNAKAKPWEKDILVSWADARTRAKMYCKKLSANISGKQSSVLILSYKDSYTERAETILASVVDAYNEVWLYDKNKAARNTSEFINERLALLELELGGIEDELKQFKSTNNLTDVKSVAQSYLEESSLYAAKSFEINNQLSIAKYIKDYLNDAKNELNLIPANSGIANPHVESQISHYNELVLQRDRLLSNSGATNPLIADINASLVSIKSAVLNSVDNLIATLKLQADKIKTQEDQILRRISQNSGQEFMLLSMQRQQKVKESLYVFLLQKREENEITALVNVGNVRVIMRPNGPSLPDSPKALVILAMAFLIGIAIPFAYYYLNHILDTSVKSRSDLDIAKLPFLAEIPLANMGKRRLFVTKKQLYDDANTKIFVKHGKRDVLNEAYRVLRTNVDMVLGRKEGNKIVMLTSINPNSGKTFTSINLAASMAVKDVKVLVIDLDLRKGSLSSVLGLKSEGISRYLSTNSENPFDYIVNIDSNLDCMPSGALPPNPSELLLDTKFKSMLEELKKVYDYIFLDCPPVEIVADASIITEYVDMTIFVVRAGMFDKKMIPLLNNFYENDRYKHLALLLNGVNVENQTYTYGYGYGYGNNKQN